ncbi:OLC1v1027243C2 [Oldenlandia corymbosa var. corymbosa]|uniref:AT-hook motif nuclear-localized protein n=1 Tax=Oldenlandia corymbosa var. corymbosa TaxID=529605 RepID=A0AAV1CAV7_OLDCO|nr:OLC1v1027243C2 [Oldenlandia corymbosa var. corymbosa]
MEEKEGMNSGGFTVTTGSEASESFRIEPSAENPGQLSGSAVKSSEVTPISAASPTTEAKKRRGRPRKYAPDGSVPVALSPMPISASIPLSGDYSSWKQNSRGRHVDSYKKKHKPEVETPGPGVAYSVGANFTPHVITVNTGEDVMMKIISFSQQGSRAICVLAANGSISNVTLRQANSSGGTLTYEGRFEILSLTGSFMPSDNGVTKSRSGGMSVSLAGPDGRVLGGGLAGMLLAAGPVQVVVGSFLPGHQLEQKSKKQKFEHTTAYPSLPPAVPISEERTEGPYSGQNPNIASSASYLGDNMVSMNVMHTTVSAPESIISAPAVDQNHSKCEVSC